MGSAESREGRRASFGMDEEERVRVLQGIRLSENVVNRMKEPGQPSRVGPLAPPAAALGSSGGREKDSKPPRPDCSSGRGPPRVPVDPLERCDWEQAVLQDELVRVATADRQAAEKPRSVTLRRGEGGVDQEQQRLAQRARELESQEAELRRRDAFYKEQLGRLERQVLPRRLQEGCLVCPAPGLSGLCLQNQQGELCDGTRAGTQQVLITASFPPVDEIREEGRQPFSRVS
uniref:Uncharacterized protein n=1 Tax=Ovis aries TaxID=9940 RepID=A0AC11C3M2_SHEEP